MIGGGDDGVVLPVRPVDGIEHHRAVFHAPADWPELIHRPRQRHGACTRHASERRAETRRSTSSRWRRNRAERLASDGESNESGGGCRGRAGGGSARALIYFPRMPGHRPKPDVALCQFSQRELCDEDGTSRVESLDDGRVRIDHLISERSRAPGCLVASYGEKILSPPRNSVQRSAIMTAPDFLVRGVGLPEGAILRERDHTAKNGIVLLETGNVHLRQLHRRDAPSAYQLRQLGHRQERELVKIRRDGARRWAAADHCAARRGRNLLSGRERVEEDGWTNRVRQGDFVKRLYPLLLLLEPVEHELALGGIEMQSSDFFGARDRLYGDLGSSRQLRPEYAGEERRTESDTREVTHEGSTVQSG